MLLVGFRGLGCRFAFAQVCTQRLGLTLFAFFGLGFCFLGQPGLIFLRLIGHYGFPDIVWFQRLHGLSLWPVYRWENEFANYLAKLPCLQNGGVAVCARFQEQCRRSSGVERTIGNGEVDSSILSGGTIKPLENKRFFLIR